MGEIKPGTIINHDERGLLIAVPYDNIDMASKRQYEKVLVELQDSRTLSPDQRKKAHALIGEIAEFSGDTPDWMKRHVKIEFMADRLQSLEKKIFSLSNADMTTVREFISFLIDFILRFDIPTKIPLYELCEDIEKYIYATLINKKCALCGKRGELHHDPPLGMGIDRTETPHLGRGAICLCREHHTLVHSQGRSMLDEHHLIPVPIDEAIARVYKLKSKRKEAAR